VDCQTCVFLRKSCHYQLTTTPKQQRKTDKFHQRQNAVSVITIMIIMIKSKFYRVSSLMGRSDSCPTNLKVCLDWETSGVCTEGRGSLFEGSAQGRRRL